MHSDIKMKFSFEILSIEEAYIWVNVYLPSDMYNVTVLAEVYCEENKAHWRETLEFPTYGKQESFWQGTKFPMFLACRDFTNFHINVYPEITMIEYCPNTEKQPFYQSVFMRKQCEYKWNINKSLLDEFKRASPNQIFVSDTFDEYNNNWYLWICPKNYFKGNSTNNTRKCRLVLYLNRKPYNINDLYVSVTVKSSLNEEINVKQGWVYTGTGGKMECGSICDSVVLNDIDQLSVTVQVEILSVNGDQDFMINYADIFE